MLGGGCVGMVVVRVTWNWNLGRGIVGLIDQAFLGIIHWVHILLYRRGYASGSVNGSPLRKLNIIAVALFDDVSFSDSAFQNLE